MPTASEPAPLAPPTPSSFDELARSLPPAEPRRGSVTQPPPAWEPDEVTLGFAMITDETGIIRELPEPIVLATILLAVESDRNRLLNRLTGRSDEEVVAVANLYWPLLVLPGRKAPEVAIFDGTGVWRRTFRYTLLPPLETVQSLLNQKLQPVDELQRLRSLEPYFRHDPGAEVLTVEGFLPVDPPLLFDVLAQSEFRSDPQSPHAGFLPARHDVAWYHDVVRSMQQWFDRFETDLATLKAVRDRVQAIADTTGRELDQEQLELQTEMRSRVADATPRAAEAVAGVQQTSRAAIHERVETIRQQLSVIAHAEHSASTADTLGQRAKHRGVDPEVHAARASHARSQIRQAKRKIEEARSEIEVIHAKERSDVERITLDHAELERQYVQRLAEKELFRDEFQSAGSDVIQAIEGQLAARDTQKNLLAGYFLPLPSLSSVRVVWFPLWTATLRGPRGVRQLVFPPMQVRSHTGLGTRIKQLFGGIVLPLEPRTAQFDRVLRTTMEESLARDPWLSTACQELTRASDVLADPDVLQRLGVGLKELVHAKWITRKQEQDLLSVYEDHARRRVSAMPDALPSPLPPPPSGTGPATGVSGAGRQGDAPR